MSSLRGISIRVILAWLGGGIVLNINIHRARLEEGACSSTMVEFNGAKVHFREVFHSVHAKFFEAHCVVSVQQINVLFRGFELHHCVFFCLAEKGTQLVVPLLEVVKMSILLNSISFQLLNQVLQLLGLDFGLSYHLRPMLAIILNLLDPRLKQDPHLIHLSGLPRHSYEL